jgi:hypothetical protein
MVIFTCNKGRIKVEGDKEVKCSGGIGRHARLAGETSRREKLLSKAGKAISRDKSG